MLLKQFKTFHRCISKVGRAYHIIYKPFIVNIMLFLLWSTLKLHARKCQNWGTLSVREIGSILLGEAFITAKVFHNLSLDV